MKVAVTVFKNRVSPRIDVSDSLFIYEIQKGAIKQKERLPLVFDYPAELVSFLQKKGIKKIICGGCPHRLSTFLFQGAAAFRFRIIIGLERRYRTGDEPAGGRETGPSPGVRPCGVFGRALWEERAGQETESLKKEKNRKKLTKKFFC